MYTDQCVANQKEQEDLWTPMCVGVAVDIQDIDLPLILDNYT